MRNKIVNPNIQNDAMMVGRSRNISIEQRVLTTRNNVIDFNNSRNTKNSAIQLRNFSGTIGNTGLAVMGGPGGGTGVGP